MRNPQVMPIDKMAAPIRQNQAAAHAPDLSRFLFAGQALVDGCQAIYTEMLAFWQSRLKDGLATSQRLLECDTPQGALEIQLDYLKAGLQAHLDQSTKVGALLTNALTDSLMPTGAVQRRDPPGALAA